MFVNLKYVFLIGEYKKDLYDSNKKIINAFTMVI